MLDLHAEKLADACVDADLFSLAQLAHTHNLPHLRSAARQNLPRAGLSQLERWHTEARASSQPALAQDISGAYLHCMKELATVEPTEAWSHLTRLQNRWQVGLPTVIRESEAPLRAVFNNVLQATPLMAAHEMGNHIVASSSTPERQQRLAEVQESVSALAFEPQLVFLAHLHRRMMFEPDLARPSRQQIVTLASAANNPGLTDRLHEMALGDEVLQNQLKPPPAPAAPPAPPPGLMRRTLGRLRNLLP